MSAEYRREAFKPERFTGARVENTVFIDCDFSRNDLSDTQFVHCRFYEQDALSGCTFQRAKLKNASFVDCDLTLCDFRFVNALGIEIKKCKAQGADFRSASFMNMITSKTWFCSAFIIQSNLSYANFSKVVLEKCELWENRWTGTHLEGATLSGSDLSGGEFTSFDWRNVDVTHCDLTNAVLGDLDLRNSDLTGVKLDQEQASMLLEKLGIIVMP